MLAAHIDQENLVHSQQTAAAAKPLNQSVRGFTAKTPGNKLPKTPFKLPLNDENAPFAAGKSVLKTNNGKADEKGFTGARKGAKNAFVTPAGPRIRPALGLKTTNAKANVLLTPAPKGAEPSPSKTQPKTVSPRLRRAKVKVHQAEVLHDEAEDGDLEVEYMPPRSKPLPDYPSDDEFGPDKKFPQFDAENFTRGWPSVYMNPVDGNGVGLIQRLEAEERAKSDKYVDQLLQRSMDDVFEQAEQACLEDVGLVSTKQAKSDSRKAAASATATSTATTTTKPSTPATLLSKSAASALARSTNSPSTMQRHLSSKPRPAAASSGALNIRKSRAASRAVTDPSATRFAAANVASRSTLGYTQGRAASHKLRKPGTAVFRDVSDGHKPNPQGATAAVMARSNKHLSSQEPFQPPEDILKLDELSIDDDVGLDDELMRSAVTLVDDDDLDSFQLAMPGCD